MPALDAAAQLGAQYGRQRRPGSLDQSHPTAESGCRGRDLQTDESRADDEDAPPGNQRRTKCVGVGHASQHVHVPERLELLEHYRAGAGCNHEPAVVDPGSVGEPHLPLVHVQACDRAPCGPAAQETNALVAFDE